MRLYDKANSSFIKLWDATALTKNSSKKWSQAAQQNKVSRDRDFQATATHGGAQEGKIGQN